MDQLEGLQQTTTTNLGAVTDRQTYWMKLYKGEVQRSDSMIKKDIWNEGYYITWEKKIKKSVCVCVCCSQVVSSIIISYLMTVLLFTDYRTIWWNLSMFKFCKELLKCHFKIPLNKTTTETVTNYIYHDIVIWIIHFKINNTFWNKNHISRNNIVSTRFDHILNLVY